MAVYTNASATWSNPLIVSAASILQVKAGAVAVSAETAPAEQDGIELKHNWHSEGFAIPAGTTIRYKLARGEASALFVIEVLG